MPESAIRFTVKNIAGQRAATWKCWSERGKEDVYVTCQELGGVLKTSFHGSGKCHVAFVEDFFEKSVSEEDRTERGRFVEKWSRPQTMAPGVTLVYRIITPWSSVTLPDHETASIVSVPAPPDGKALELLLVLIEGTTRVTDWPGKNTGTQLVGSYALPSGTTVWIVWRQIDIPKLPPLQGTPKFFGEAGPEDLEQAAIGPVPMRLRAALTHAYLC